mmetsp:Transcript_12347/g.49560  ORF Transcript_12347/g.49560 Transcript_12347/m.49560 type:complete len:86 (-) Transcript_12347:755-1012(-)
MSSRGWGRKWRRGWCWGRGRWRRNKRLLQIYLEDVIYIAIILHYFIAHSIDVLWKTIESTSVQISELRENTVNSSFDAVVVKRRV